MKYDDTEDAHETAERSRVEGNEYVRLGKYRWAVDAYTTGIRARCADRRLCAVLHANRAAAQRRLGNRGSAVRDCLRAWRFDAHHFKAIQRGAECLLELGHAHRCLAWAEMTALTTVDDAEEEANVTTERRATLERHVTEMARIVTAATTRRRREERDERRAATERRRGVAERRKLLGALRARGLRFEPPLPQKVTTGIHDEDEDDAAVAAFESLRVRSPQTSETPPQERVYVEDRNGASFLRWPLLIQYIGAGHTDMIADCDEDTALDELLMPVFEEPRAVGCAVAHLPEVSIVLSCNLASGQPS